MESADDRRTDDLPDESSDPIPPCVVCSRDAVTIDRDDSAMCAKHAALFVTSQRRSTVTERGRVVR